MGIIVGGTRVQGFRYGNTEIIKRMVGDQQIWPPVQMVSYVGSTIYLAATGSFNTHAVGDLLVVAAISSTANVPSLPVGWNNAYTSADGANLALRLGWKIATAANSSNQNWTGASYLTTYVFRGSNTSAPFGALCSQAQSNTKAPVSPAFTPINNAGESLMVHSYVNNGNSGSPGTYAPPGFIAKNRNARIINNMRLDSTLGNPVAEYHSGGNLAAWRMLVFEVVPSS
jgi:hypothetical protein